MRLVNVKGLRTDLVSLLFVHAFAFEDLHGSLLELLLGRRAFGVFDLVLEDAQFVLEAGNFGVHLVNAASETFGGVLQRRRWCLGFLFAKDATHDATG